MCRRLCTGLKYRKISYFECYWNLYNWLGAGSEPWVILRLFLIFQDLSLMILIKRILIKKKRVQCRTADIVQWKHGKFLASRHTCYISSEVAVHSPNRRRTCPLLAVACDHCSTAPWGSSPPSASGEWVRIQGPWVLLNFWTLDLILASTGAGC